MKPRLTSITNLREDYAKSYAALLKYVIAFAIYATTEPNEAVGAGRQHRGLWNEGRLCKWGQRRGLPSTKKILLLLNVLWTTNQVLQGRDHVKKKLTFDDTACIFA